MTVPLLLFLQQAAAQASPQSATAGVFGELLRVLAVLALISAGAFWGLRWLARRGALGPLPGAGTGAVQLRVLARVPLEARKALYLVQVGERTLLLATGEGGPPSLLVELEREVVAGTQRGPSPTDESSGGAAHG